MVDRNRVAKELVRLANDLVSGSKLCAAEKKYFKEKDAVLKTAATKQQCKGTGTKIGAPSKASVKE